MKVLTETLQAYSLKDMLSIVFILIVEILHKCVTMKFYTIYHHLISEQDSSLITSAERYMASKIYETDLHVSNTIACRVIYCILLLIIKISKSDIIMAKTDSSICVNL